MPYQNTRSQSQTPQELTNLDGTSHWCPSWCKCCEEALERAKSKAKAKIIKKR